MLYLPKGASPKQPSKVHPMPSGDEAMQTVLTDFPLGANIYLHPSTFLLQEDNDWCTGTRGLSHKLFLLQEDDDLCTGPRFKYY